MQRRRRLKENRIRSASPKYGRIRTSSELGKLAREERRRQGLTLKTFYESSDITTRFMSEFERGKSSAGRVLETLQMLGLEVIVVPRAEADVLLGYLNRRSSHD